MRKTIALFLIVILTSALSSGCTKHEKSDKLKIVTTVFSCYDWTREILGKNIDNVDLSFLLNNGVDLHSYQPTSGDLLSITKSDLFIYVGGESDKWVKNVLKNDKNINALNMMDTLKSSILPEETVEGMQSDDESETEENDEIEYDEHIWLSFKNASAICDEICAQLCRIDSKNAESYGKNTNEYKEKLSGLNDRYLNVVNTAKTKTVLFADRFPFRYLTQDLGLKYYAAFSGCSSESDATFKTISFLAEKLKTEKLTSVLILEGNDERIARSVIQTSKLKDIKILPINSMQTATVDKGKNNDTYLSIAESNLNILKQALN